MLSWKENKFYNLPVLFISLATVRPNEKTMANTYFAILSILGLRCPFNESIEMATSLRKMQQWCGLFLISLKSDKICV